MVNKSSLLKTYKVSLFYFVVQHLWPWFLGWKNSSRCCFAWIKLLLHFFSSAWSRLLCRHRNLSSGSRNLIKYHWLCPTPPFIRIVSLKPMNGIPIRDLFMTLWRERQWSWRTFTLGWCFKAWVSIDMWRLLSKITLKDKHAKYRINIFSQIF